MLLDSDLGNGEYLVVITVIWILEVMIMVVIASQMKRKHRRWRRRGKKSKRSKVKVTVIANDVHQNGVNPHAEHSQRVPADKMVRGISEISDYDGYVMPQNLFLRFNHEGKTEQELHSLYEEGMRENGSDGMPTQPQLEAIGSTSQEIVNIPHKSVTLRYKQQRHVTCCCSKIICSLRTCLQLQTIVTAASIWGSVALFLLNKISWTVYGLLIFICVTTVWSMLFF